MADLSDDDGGHNYYDDKNFLTDDEDEVMRSDDSSDDDDDDDDDDDFDLNDDDGSGTHHVPNRFQIEHQKDEMASDIEDDDEDNYLPSSQAWGKNKQLYYNTDYVDKDFRSQKHKDEELAQFEEEEALAIQKRLLASIDEADLGLDLVMGDDSTKRVTYQKQQQEEDEDEKPIRTELNLEKFDEKQKLAIINQESPELQSLLSDYRKYSDELSTKLEPLLSGLVANNAPLSNGLRYLKLRFLTIINYCTNLSLYFALMTSDEKQNVKNHPIIKRLLMHKNILTELDLCVQKAGKQFVTEMNFALQKLKQNVQLKFVVQQPSEVDQQQTKSIDKLDKLKMNDNDEDDLDFAEYDGEYDEDGKRPITYQMEKNKGLIPKRKREQRNPRVKYRKKFEKANIRRKGQVREPRKEMKKYSGELTGINVRSIKSVKFR